MEKEQTQKKPNLRKFVKQALNDCGVIDAIININDYIHGFGDAEALYIAYDGRYLTLEVFETYDWDKQQGGKSFKYTGDTLDEYETFGYIWDKAQTGYNKAQMK